ncbi:MAG: hypothetical protein ACYTGG_03870 [Planctomycetota bacterium]|jgi:hypothetical protein
MSVFLSEKYLKYRKALAGGEIERDLACRGCGYNLRGLKYGRNCPECGQMITVQRGLNDVLTSGSPEERQLWRLGLALATGCIVVVVASRILFFIGGLGGGSRAMTRAYVSAGLLVSVAWVVSSWLVTPATLDVTWPRLRSLRRMIRVTQPMWVLAYVLLMVKHFGNWAPAAGVPWVGTAPPWIDVSNLFCRTVASIGMLVLVGLMSVVAKEAELDTASTRLERSIAWVVLFTILLLGMFAIFGGQIPWIMLLFIIPMLVGWSWFLVLMALGLYEMYAHVTWTLRHAIDAHGRQERIDTLRAALETEAQSVIRPLENPPRTDVPIEGETEASPERARG